MAQNFRQNKILQLVRKDGEVSVDSLSDSFQVTAQTIRRDLNHLSNEGVLTRVHGGAILSSGIENIGYEDRRALAANEKDKIARLCAEHIPNGASLFLNIGTSTEAVARALLLHDNLMIITNNMNITNILAQNSNFEIIVAGGILRRSDGGIVGEITVDFIKQFKVDYAVIGTSALDEDGNLLDFDFREVKVSQAIINNSRKTFLVSDTSKFKRVAPVKIASLKDLDIFFTDKLPPRAICNLCNKFNVDIQIAK